MNKINAEANGTEVTSEELRALLGEESPYTWEEFYSALEDERRYGDDKCPKASYIALELLRPQIMALPWRSSRTNSETINDVFQDAYIIITDHVRDFDRSKSEFKTYIMKWLQGLARDTRNDGISNYQREKMGFKLYSSDALVSKDGANGEDGEMLFEFSNEKDNTEYIFEQKEKARSNALFRQTLKNAEISEESITQDAYVNAACYHLFLGGIENMPDCVREELEMLV